MSRCANEATDTTMNVNPSGHPSNEETQSGESSYNSASLGTIPPELVLAISTFLDDASLAHLAATCTDISCLLASDMKHRAQDHALGAAHLYHRNFKYSDGATPGIDLPIEIIERSNPHACTKYLPESDERFGRMVFEGKLDAVQALLDAGAQADSYTSSGAWMLSLAVLSPERDMVKLLLKYGANPSSQDLIYRMSPLAYAARFMDDELVITLISAGGDLTEFDVLNNITSFCSNQAIRLALEHGPVESAGHGGETPLHCAVRREELAVVDLILPLLPARAIDAASDSGDTPLHLAMRNRDPCLASRLIGAGANIARRNNMGYNPLLCALMNRHFQIAADLINRGAPLNVINHRGESALHLAVEAAATDIVRMLLSRGVDVNARGTSPATGLATPLHYAVRRRSPEMVDVLLNEGPVRPDLTLTDEYDRTPKQAAELFEEFEIVEMLAL